MKKIFLGFVFIILFTAQAFGADYYFVGVDAFKKGCYDKAIANLEHATRINPKNVNARYYLAQSYLKYKRISDAAEQYNRIILLAPGSDAALLSEKGLSLIQQSYSKGGFITSDDELAKYKDNYLDYVLTDSGDINKWKSFPISVYIEPEKQKAAVQNAFKQWQEKSGKLISFNFVDSPQKAKIVVSFKNKLETSSTEKSFEAGDAKPYYQGIYIVKSDIRILTINPASNQEFDNNFIMATSLHEIGHSLGFRGHSPDENDVMAATTSTPKLELTKRDVNTLNLFYRLDKKTLLAQKSTKNTGPTDLKLQQALDYVKISPEKAVGWANLGEIYRSKKMYSESIQYYNKAISIEPNNANLYAIIGSAYLSKGDKQNAFTNMKKSCDLDKSNKYYLAQFVQLCSIMGKEDVAKSYAEAYAKANP